MEKTADEIASIMQAICSRKSMYFQPTDPTTATNFIGGFVTGCFVCGVDLNLQSAEHERGWGPNSIGPIKEMRQRGMNDDAIVDELLAILTVAVKQAST